MTYALQGLNSGLCGLVILAPIISSIHYTHTLQSSPGQSRPMPYVLLYFAKPASSLTNNASRASTPPSARPMQSDAGHQQPANSSPQSSAAEIHTPHFYQPSGQDLWQAGDDQLTIQKPNDRQNFHPIQDTTEQAPAVSKGGGSPAQTLGQVLSHTVATSKPVARGSPTGYLQMPSPRHMGQAVLGSNVRA